MGNAGDTVNRVTFTNKSGTITVGGTAQSAAAARKGRSYFFLQNPSTETESLWFSLDATAVAASPSIELQPGQSYESGAVVPIGAVSVIAATTGHKFTAKEA